MIRSLMQRIAGDQAPQRTRRDAAPRRPIRLGLEDLESRTVPTILFTPAFPGTHEVAVPGDPIAQQQAASLSSPNVVFIFAGSYWTTTQGKADQQTLTADMKAVVSSSYLSALTQYGSNGKAVYYSSFQDNTTPTLTGVTPTGADLMSYVQSEVKSHPGSVPSGTNVLYMVVNDPKDSAKGPVTNGLNTFTGTLHTAYVGAVANSSGAIDTDGFTQVFSHELAESMVPDIHVNDPGGLNLVDYQIADGEPENGSGYTYRLSNGMLVQAYWSERDDSWIVPDGNSESIEGGGWLVHSRDGEDVSDHRRVAREPAAVLLRSRLLPADAADLQLDPQQFHQQRHPPRLRGASQVVLDPRPVPRLPGPIEPRGHRIDPTPVPHLRFVHDHLRRPVRTAPGVTFPRMTHRLLSSMSRRPAGGTRPDADSVGTPPFRGRLRAPPTWLLHNARENPTRVAGEAAAGGAAAEAVEGAQRHVLLVIGAEPDAGQVDQPLEVGLPERLGGGQSPALSRPTQEVTDSWVDMAMALLEDQTWSKCECP